MWVCEVGLHLEAPLNVPKDLLSKSELPTWPRPGAGLVGLAGV